MNDFERDNDWQKKIRDRILAPYFYGKYAFEGRYVFIDKGHLAKILQKRYAVDTIIQNKTNTAICIEEKIVRWPKKQDAPYEAFALETHSCTKPGHESDGWMRYGQADFLLYCFANKNETALVCYLIDFPKLQEWFCLHETEFPLYQMWGTLNETRGRVVPILSVMQAVPVPWHKKIGASSYGLQGDP